MKKLGILMAAAMMLVGTATFANTVKTAHTAAKASVAKQAQTGAKPAKKGHKKHHHKKAGAPAKKA